MDTRRISSYEPTLDEVIAFMGNQEQQKREQQWLKQNPQADMRPVEQPWIDPIDALAGGVSSLPRGLAAAGMDMAIDPFVGFGMEQMFDGSSEAMPAALAGKRGIKKLAQNVDRDLFAVHNLTPEKLAHSSSLGGIPVPSVAVINKDNPFTGYGDISLVADSSMIDRGSGAKVFGGDAYSPRYPTVKYEENRGASNALRGRLDQYKDEIGASYGDYPDIEDTGRKALERSPLMQRDFLNSVGERVIVKKWDDGKPSSSKTGRWMENKIAKKYPNEWQEFVTDEYNGLLQRERIFSGFTNSGTRKYLPHDLDTVVKLMKKDIRGGENFNYGVGSIRAKHTPQFKSVAEIKKNKGKLLGAEDFGKIKDEVTDEFFALQEQFQSSMKYKPDNQFMMSDIFSEHLKEAGDVGLDRVMREYYNEGTDPAPIRAYLEKLKNMPTEYFEAVLPRGVDIGEFKGAVIPKGLPQHTMDTLRRSGIDRFQTYKKGDDISRVKALNRFKDLAFMGGGLSAGWQMIEDEDLINYK